MTLRNSLLLGLALVAIGLWFNLVGYSGVFSSYGSLDSAFANTRLSFYIGRIVIAAALLFAPGYFDKNVFPLTIVMTLLMSFGTLGLALSFNQTLIAPTVLGSGASLLLGISYMWVDAALYVRISRSVERRLVIPTIIGAQIAEQLLGTLFGSWAFGSTQLIICCLAPVIPLAVLLGVKAPRSPKRQTPPLEGEARSHFLMLIAITGVAVLAMGAMSSVGTWGANRPDYDPESGGSSFLLNGIACVFAVVCSLSLRHSSEKPISYRFQIPFLLISCSLIISLCANTLLESDAFLVNALMTGVEYFSHILFWAMIVQAMDQLEGSPYRPAGMGMLTYSVFSLLWISAIESRSDLALFVLISLVCAIVFVVSVHPRLLYERSAPSLVDSDELNEYAVQGDRLIPTEANSIGLSLMLARRCALIAHEHNLTKREAEVLNLLAQGRTKTAICQLLTISEGTVRTHTAHIFHKLDINSQQELIAIVYGSDVEDWSRELS